MTFIRPLIFLAATIIVASACTRQQSPAPEKGVSFALNQYRKQHIDSIQYQIELDIPAGKSGQISGKEIVTFHLNAVDSALVLDFNVDASALQEVRVGGKKVDYQFVNEHIVIDSKHLSKGKNEVGIDFVAGDQSLNRSDDYLYTLFVPDRASTCFPLFDQPNLKASYQLTLKTPEGWEAVSNGKLNAKTVENGKSVYQFGKTKPVSSYLFAFAAGKFFKETRTMDGREMTMYYRETDTTKVNRNRDDVFQLHAKSLAWLEEYTNIDYPFGKFDFVLLPSFQYGGMEHPGAIFYNEPALFLDENASVNRRMARASVIAHESAHMWFGDLVTMDWFNDVWLKEVFANFMAAKIVHPSFPEINHELRFLLAHYPNAYEVDRTAGTNPILQQLGNLKNAGTLYGAIIYMKAPIVMRQLERKIGEELMRESLREYLKTYSFGNARWDDLIGIIDKRSPEDITTWSNVWVKTPGMPEYGIEAGKLVQLKDSVSGRVWEQPLVLKTMQNGQLVFPNNDGTGYGYFKMDTASKAWFFAQYGNAKVSDPVFKGAMLVNSWEGLLRGDGPGPEKLVNSILNALPKEQNPLLVDYLLGNLQTDWWAFLNADQRAAYQARVEGEIWQLLNSTRDKGIQTSYFRAFKALALTDDGWQKMHGLWTGKLEVKGLVLSEEDKISLAYELALKGKGDGKAILNTQLNATKNPDRKARMQFVIPALSASEAERDAFFETLKKEENREKEAWVLDALTYLHHPLREQSALKYLRPSLDLLQEIQLTGDIFFPTRWLHNTFAGHSSPEAARIAQTFLKEHPDYPYFLKNKILQATDLLDRSVKLSATYGQKEHSPALSQQ
ncbi:aminopeptidase N [Dyadobacter sp. BE34]|uniref:Aminopeptidase N n=1 Tax=Dyadobacter fermentans TaxID=94254 RepID=A0ABU1R5W4_9BACT|nr:MULTISPECIES: M1 family aminopeptidase [Dyadobacter]MDR6808799.1 aminopeptidase N [Dyadobacter fermentans]MDR7046542.1 aminopeptidase N [Dyadobacter sp. BE242]MDR7200855.1 aminopeptidase N [Dyadobacter sp. BE34]MDR7218815.1 aminopeptidase N [Dyadobacter sp. BE31]MDR7266745.1 aminopeptidase N [Dyadobacter sp. BE32]